MNVTFYTWIVIHKWTNWMVLNWPFLTSKNQLCTHCSINWNVTQYFNLSQYTSFACIRDSAQCALHTSVRIGCNNSVPTPEWQSDMLSESWLKPDIVGRFSVSHSIGRWGIGPLYTVWMRYICLWINSTKNYW